MSERIDKCCVCTEHRPVKGVTYNGKSICGVCLAYVNGQGGGEMKKEMKRVMPKGQAMP